MSKRIRLLILTLFISFFGMNITYSQESFNYNSGVKFKVDKIDKWSRIYTGSGYYYTKKGYKYVMLYLSLLNMSGKTQLIDFSKFRFIDVKNKIYYNIDLALDGGPITWIYTDNKKKLRNSLVKKVKLAIVCPEDYKPEFLMVDENLIPLDSLLFDDDWN